MNTVWTSEVIGVEKPIIAMCHLNALPGDPHFDVKGGMKSVIEWARKDFLALQNGGVDAVMFSNEFSQPYMVKVEPITVAAMAFVIAELMPDIRIPFGVDVIVDPMRTLDLAAVTGAKFIRSVFSGVYASDLGLWDTNGSVTARYRQARGLEDVRITFSRAILWILP
jgi:membrane complex biogenesis BtpA family protein